MIKGIHLEMLRWVSKNSARGFHAGGRYEKKLNQASKQDKLVGAKDLVTL